MKIKLTKGDLKFLFSNFEYFEHFIKIMKELRITVADDVRFELEEDKKNEPIQS